MMVELPHSLFQELETRVGERIVSQSPVSGGCISSASLIATPNNSYFVKWNFKAPADFFEAEAAGLSELASAGAAVPKVVASSRRVDAHAGFIILEALRPNGGRHDEALLGEMLAQVHRKWTPQYGYACDNYIGLTAQQNGWSDSWSAFFLERRLRFQLNLGHAAGWVSRELKNAFEQKALEIQALLDEAETKPSLLHGDLWSGNVFWSEAGPVLIDPAVYFGHREADLAFTELFGGFGKRFYSAYESSFPLASGYERRRDIYNLYHLMNHANLFGGGYVNDVARVLEALR